MWRTQADQATCFEIYKYEDSYIIHGEFEISRLDKDGKIIWQQGVCRPFSRPIEGEKMILLSRTNIFWRLTGRIDNINLTLMVQLSNDQN